jgi:DNA-binding NarL/FixJ family response regulator
MKLLIVDDSDLLQDRLKKALLAADDFISLEQARSCHEARELFLSFRPDKVILDIALPDGSGISLLQEFKESWPSVKVYMLTNYPTAEFRNRCIELGADLFFDKSNLSKIIESVNCTTH